MLQEILDEIILFSVSFIANLFASVSGGGAGFVQFPLLILMGLPFAEALGTHKVAVIFLGVGALSKKKSEHGKFNLDRQIALLMLFIGRNAYSHQRSFANCRNSSRHNYYRSRFLHFL